MEIGVISRFWWNEKNKKLNYFVHIFEDGNLLKLTDAKKKDGCSDLNLFLHFLRTAKFVPQKSTLHMHCSFHLESRGSEIGCKKISV